MCRAVSRERDEMEYQKINSETIDRWCREGWEWGQPLSHEEYLGAKNGNWSVKLTPVRAVPRGWFGELSGKKVLGLASGGGQQIPVFAALGAECTVLDYSQEQCESERKVAQREGYGVSILCLDMTEPLPFPEGSFDLIFHPVSNCYIRETEPVFRECFRVLKPGGRLLGGYDTGINYILDEGEEKIVRSLPFDPTADRELYEYCMEGDWGIQFSHTLEEQIGGQLRAGFIIRDLYEDTNSLGNLHEKNIPSFVAVLAEKPV